MRARRLACSARRTQRSSAEPVREVQQLLAALERDAFGGEYPDILRRSSEVNRGIARNSLRVGKL